MIIEILIALLIGCFIGTITGLIPGIHVNLISLIVVSFSVILLKFISPITITVFIVSMAITHTFVDYIPSIFLGAPDEDSFLSILPGHKLLLKGQAYFAIIFTLYGSLSALLIIILFTPIFIFILPKIYPYISRIMPLILILVSGYLILTEKNKKLFALIIFLLAGFLGIVSLNLNLNEPLIPLLTGLFGASNLIISIKQKIKIPNQQIIKLKKIPINKKSIIKSGFAAIIAAPFTAFLPGLGASQAALIGKEVSGDLNQKEFLCLLGAINTVVMGLSFIALYAINKTRTGTAVAISKIIETLSFSNLIIIIVTIIVSGIIAFFITLKISKIIAKNISKFNYSKISIFILIILIIITFYFTGIIGLLIFLVSSFLGITAILLGIKRMHLMGCLLIPTIFFYLFL